MILPGRYSFSHQTEEEKFDEQEQELGEFSVDIRFFRDLCFVSLRFLGVNRSTATTQIHDEGTLMC